MKLSLIKDAKIDGKDLKKGALLDVSEEAGCILIASCVAEAPRKQKLAEKEPISAPAKGKKGEK